MPDCNWTIIGKPPAMLDCHVAEIYQKETYRLNEQVERNKEYFKEEWRFQPTIQEWNVLKSIVQKELQEGITSCDTLSQLFGSKAFSNTSPWFYTEKGVDMAAFFQKTPAAKQYAIFIVESFQQFKEQLRVNPSLDTLLQEQKSALQMAKKFGFQSNQAILFANHLILEKYGVDLLQMGGQPALISKPQEVRLTPTAIGQLLGGLSPQQVNKKLEEAKLQESFKGAKNRKYWKPTEKGRKFIVLVDTNATHNSGKPVQQLLWLESVLKVLKSQPIQLELQF